MKSNESRESGRDRKELFEFVLESMERELSFPEKVRAYVLLKELLFWEEIKREADRRRRIIMELLPEEIRHQVFSDETQS